MFGQNTKRPAIFNDGTNLEIKSIFKTIQGEGPFVGMPAIFIRLGGCNLACNFCDTDFEDFNMLTINNIIEEVEKLTINIKLVVITGGEPFRQPIELLCYKLLDLDYIVQIETNGTLYRDLPDKVHIVCSPKAGKNGYALLRDDLLSHINALKFLVAKNIPKYSNIPEVGQSKYNIPVFIQPMDQNN
ncbi:MAG: 7-carboxy-7-deazaguanine synthase QueE, partial [Rickettsia sp.]|nr:7-carboxy-7-deazaguanine synthase QueE [Rickettsia sp.]